MNCENRFLSCQSFQYLEEPIKRNTLEQNRLFPPYWKHTLYCMQQRILHPSGSYCGALPVTN